MNYLADSDNATYGGILASAKPIKQARVIETQMLDGSWSVQTIGAATQKVSVDYYGSTATRRLLETAAEIQAPIYVYWKDKIYRGLISGGRVDWQRWSRNKVELAERITFTLLALEVSDQ